jgi:hypothetical protein
MPWGRLPEGEVGPDGRFVLEGVPPGRYRLQTVGYLKTAMLAGVDTLDFPLEVAGDRDIEGVVLTVSDRVSELTGRLTEADGEPAYDYTVVAAATDSQYWTPGSRRILTTRPGEAGRYTFRNLPPGSYHLAAVTDIEPGSQYDPEFLTELGAASVRVTVTEGSRQVQDLRVAARTP